MFFSGTTQKSLILVAEDDSDDRFLLEDAIKRRPFSSCFTFVEDGEQVMDYLFKRGDFTEGNHRKYPSLIILDLNMPRKDGREVLKEIKSHPELCRIPIIIFSTSVSKDDLIFAYSNGANAFILKPSSFSKLVEIVESIDNFWFNIATLIPSEISFLDLPVCS